MYILTHFILCVSLRVTCHMRDMTLFHRYFPIKREVTVDFFKEFIKEDIYLEMALKDFSGSLRRKHQEMAQLESIRLNIFVLFNSQHLKKSNTRK